MNMSNVLTAMNATGMGYAGIDGVWWRPAVAPVELPQQAKAQLEDIARAIRRHVERKTLVFQNRVIVFA